MNNNLRLIALTVLVVCAGTMTACGELESVVVDRHELSGGLGDNTGGSQDTDNQNKITEIENDLIVAEAELSTAENQLTTIDILGGVSSVNTKVGGNNIIDQILEKSVVAVEQARLKMTELRAKVDAELAKLDPANPLHMVLIMRAQEIQQHLDRLEDAFGQIVNKLVQAIDKVTLKVDKKLQQMDPKDPKTWIAMLVWSQVKPKLLEYRARL